jgi:hypothetical protein
MTTTVTITTHDWPVEVMQFPLDAEREPVEGGEWATLGKVEKNSRGVFHVHSGCDLLIREHPADWEAKPA